MPQSTQPAHDKIAAWIWTIQTARLTFKGIQSGFFNPRRYSPFDEDMITIVAQNADVYIIFPLRDPISGSLMPNETISDAAFATVEYATTSGGAMTVIPSASGYSSANLSAGYYSLDITHALVPGL